MTGGVLTEGVEQLRKHYFCRDENKKTGNERIKEIMRDKRSRGIVIF